MNIRRFVILLPTLLMLVSLFPAVALAQDPDAGKVAWEQQVWQCQSCHGPAGEGLYGRPLSNSTLTEEQWIDQVRTPRRFMPGFSEAQVSDQQIRDMHAYITALPDPTGDFQRKDPGITATHPGQELMIQKNCVACHEDVVATGQGQLLESYVQQGITPTSDRVIKQLRTPFQDMPKFSETQVSDAEATQIADYLASLVSGQAAPTTLPSSGGDQGAPVTFILLLTGSALLVGGWMLRRQAIKR